MGEKAYAGVVVDLDIPAADKVFHYRIPARLQGTLGPGDQVLVPFQNRLLKGYVVSLLEKPAVTRVKEIIRNIYPHLLTKDRIRLAAWLALRYNCRLIEALRCVLPPGGGREIRGRRKELVYLEGSEEEIGRAAKDLERRAPKQARLLFYLLQEGYPLPVPEAVAAVGCSVAPLKALEEKGLVRLKAGSSSRLSGPGEDIFVSPPPERLMSQQEAACRAIIKSLEEGEFARYLLHGVTGSGKTEVYLQVIAKNLEYGRGAVVLVPEISLTPQMVARFRHRFGDKVALLHSRLSPGEKSEEWWRICRGEAPIVVGARSAVFAPVPALGLIIIDEEHDSSYKQEENPRYQTREVAEFRAREEGTVLLLGSATPAVESYYRGQMGLYRLLELNTRVDGRKMPEIELVDMRRELESGNRSIFSNILQKRINETLQAQEQVILFMNRRGFANFILCRQCGYVALCPNCDVSLTYHGQEERLCCHYCYYQEDVPSTCPVCNSVYIRHFGFGTERVEAEVQRLFPGVRTLRMDMDTTRGKDAHWQLLETFARGEADILIGTQMVTKGIDIPQVTLVGVISADTSLNFPDFRAGERTFQLLTQVAGRAGRGEKRGKVVVQTYNPDHYSIQAACRQDYRAFYQKEIQYRKDLAYPPFSQLVSMVVSAADEGKTAKAAAQLKRKLRTELPSTCRIYGPGPAPLARVRGKYRYQIVVKGVGLFALTGLWSQLRREFEQGPGRDGIGLSFDIAPVSLL
ncbi:MAG TPA: primosomal protein N' [Firmicutes bacterium]|nr:primosomal protein N' [Bacillota bacterium]